MQDECSPYRRELLEPKYFKVCSVSLTLLVTLCTKFLDQCRTQGTCPTPPVWKCHTPYEVCTQHYMIIDLPGTLLGRCDHEMQSYSPQPPLYNTHAYPCRGNRECIHWDPRPPLRPSSRHHTPPSVAARPPQGPPLCNPSLDEARGR